MQDTMPSIPYREVATGKEVYLMDWMAEGQYYIPPGYSGPHDHVLHVDGQYVGISDAELRRDYAPLPDAGLRFDARIKAPALGEMPPSGS